MILIRLMIGAVFFSEGIQMFVRADWSMLLGSLILLVVGSGWWGLDARLVARSDRGHA